MKYVGPMKEIASLRCPYCRSATQVREIHCEACDCGIKGAFAVNEFTYLEKEDLHFLRMFLQFEGRIREMEAPLGLSYPTIRSRLVQLKAKVFGAKARTVVDADEKAEGTGSALDDLALGKASFEETLEKLKNKKRGKK
jgi:hypothetical protein